MTSNVSDWDYADGEMRICFAWSTEWLEATSLFKWNFISSEPNTRHGCSYKPAIIMAHISHIPQFGQKNVQIDEHGRENEKTPAEVMLTFFIWDMCPPGMPLQIALGGGRGFGMLQW